MDRNVSLPLLDRIEIASPCHASWEDMAGDERVRHCAECNLKVHNISAMTRDEAEDVLAGLVAGRVCARFYRRADGTILVQDCPVGLARVRRAARRAVARVAALIGLVCGTGIAATAFGSVPWLGQFRLRAIRPFSVVSEWLAPGAPSATLPVGRQLMGEICAPMPVPAPAPTPQPSASGVQQ